MRILALVIALFLSGCVTTKVVPEPTCDQRLGEFRVAARNIAECNANPKCYLELSDMALYNLADARVQATCTNITP